MISTPWKQSQCHSSGSNPYRNSITTDQELCNIITVAESLTVVIPNQHFTYNNHTFHYQGANVGVIGGIGIGGSFAAFQFATKALAVFGVPGAVAGGALGLIGGCFLGGMAGSLPFATAEVLFRKYAEKFKILDVTLSQIDKILLENFEVLTEICRLLGKLKRVAKNLSETKVSTPDPSANGTDQLDDTNINFLIGFRFDEFKQASKDLEKNCDYLLDDIPLKGLGLLTIDSNTKSSKTEFGSDSRQK